MLALGVLSLAAILQCTAAFFALRLIGITRRRVAWILIAAAILFMTLRRIVPIIRRFTDEEAYHPDLPNEIIGLIISILMLIGIAKIAPIFVERFQLEKKLQMSEKKYRTLVETIPYVVFETTLDDTLSLIYVSPQISLLGLSQEECLSNSTLWTDSIHPEDRERVVREIRESLDKTEPQVTEYRMQISNGKTLHIKCITEVVFNANGEPIRLQGVLADVTCERLAAQEKDRLIDELKKALDEIHTLKGLIPICASCKKIRNDKGYWQSIEKFISEHSQAEFSHGLCPDCISKYDGSSHTT